MLDVHSLPFHSMSSSLATALRDVLDDTAAPPDDISYQLAELRAVVLNATHASSQRTFGLLNLGSSPGTTYNAPLPAPLPHLATPLDATLEEYTPPTQQMVDQRVAREAAEIKARVLRHRPPPPPPPVPAPSNIPRPSTAGVRSKRAVGGKGALPLKGGEEGEEDFKGRLGEDLINPLRDLLSGVTPTPTFTQGEKEKEKEGEGEGEAANVPPVPLDPNTYKLSAVVKGIHNMLTPKERLLSAQLLDKYGDGGGGGGVEGGGIKLTAPPPPSRLPRPRPSGVGTISAGKAGVKEKVVLPPPPPPPPSFMVKGTHFDLMDGEEEEAPPSRPTIVSPLSAPHPVPATNKAPIIKLARRTPLKPLIVPSSPPPKPLVPVTVEGKGVVALKGTPAVGRVRVLGGSPAEQVEEKPEAPLRTKSKLVSVTTRIA